MEEIDKTILRIEKAMDDLEGINIYELSMQRNRKDILFNQKRLQDGYSKLFDLRKHLIYLRDKEEQ